MLFLNPVSLHKDLYLREFIFALTTLFFASCKPMYKTSDFNLKTAPREPDYSQTENWAVLPNQWPRELEGIVENTGVKNADVFYIYPTLFTDKKDPQWNADIYNEAIRNKVLSQAIAFQASAWTEAANLYAPFYRQAHYRIFVDPYAAQGKEAGVLANQDVKRAFEFYLAHYNQGRPIIIASHSQGSLHAKRLLHEFFEGKILKEKLIAAYLVGVRIPQNEFKDIPPLVQPDAVGGFLSWNTYKRNKLPKRYDYWYKGGVVSNPISWDDQEVSNKKDHLGVLSSDKKIYPKSLKVEKIDGMLWSSVPKIPKRFFLSFIKSYHFADINLFWADIQENAKIRVSSWAKKNQSNL